MTPIAEPMTTTRGVTWDWLPPGVDRNDLSSLVGDQIRDPGFTSVSAREQPPLKFGQRPILLKLHLPTGTRTLDLSKHGSAFAPEREMLLPRGTTWTVHRVYRDKGQWLLDCEVDLT